MSLNYKKAILMLEDGSIFDCKSFAADGEILGEIVFNTSMCGYQEVLTDPSYREQIVMFTYPLIGNYGVNEKDFESKTIFLKGIVVKEYVDNYSNFQATMSLREFLLKNNIIGICDLDTRAITKKIRSQGAMKAIVSTQNFDAKSLGVKLAEYQCLNGKNLVNEVSSQEPYIWNRTNEKRDRIVVMDFGIKYNILRHLDELGYEVYVVPGWTKADEILALNPVGIMLSNGPGDPSLLTEIIGEIKKLLGKKPVFGICLGHQLIALALGAKAYKLKFGHHGANHPVKNLETNKIEITSQNHGYCIDEKTLDKNEIEITHINLYDGTLEGFRSKKQKFFTVQYHPEACPGPNDSRYLFQNFEDLIKNSINS